MTLILIKIVVTVSIVLALSVIAERLSTRWAGILGGFPLSVAIVSIFIAIEEGEHFAAMGAVHTIAGLGANLSIFATYGLLLSLRAKSSVILSVCCALGAFFTVGLSLAQIDFNLLTAIIFILLTIIFCVFAFKRFADMQIKTAVRLSFRVTFIRAASACFVVLAITGLANALGAQTAGVMASFPATVLPMIVIIHATYGPAPVLSIIKHFPIGLVATVIFCLAYALYLEELGTLLGTVLAFAASSVYLFAFSMVQQKMRRP